MVRVKAATPPRTSRPPGDRGADSFPISAVISAANELLLALQDLARAVGAQRARSSSGPPAPALERGGGRRQLALDGRGVSASKERSALAGRGIDTFDGHGPSISRRRSGPRGRATVRADAGQVPIVGQGTWQMAEGRRHARRDRGAARRHRARPHAHRHRRALRRRARRGADRARRSGACRGSDLFIVSKVLPHNASHGGTIRACEQSLRRLGTDYLDVYLLHWRGSIPLADTLGALEDLVDQGKIRALGVSNFDVGDLEEARRAATKAPIVCNQVLYHLGERHIDAGLVAYCAKHHIAVVGYSPFGHGRFPSLARGRRPRPGRLAARHGATPRQVALAFLAREPPLFTIPKASTVAHAEENAGALAAHRARPPRSTSPRSTPAFPVGRAGRDLPRSLALPPLFHARGRARQTAQPADAVRGRQAMRVVVACSGRRPPDRADAHRLRGSTRRPDRHPLDADRQRPADDAARLAAFAAATSRTSAPREEVARDALAADRTRRYRPRTRRPDASGVAHSVARRTAIEVAEARRRGAARRVQRARRDALLAAHTRPTRSPRRPCTRRRQPPAARTRRSRRPSSRSACSRTASSTRTLRRSGGRRASSDRRRGRLFATRSSQVAFAASRAHATMSVVVWFVSGTSRSRVQPSTTRDSHVALSPYRTCRTSGAHPPSRPQNVDANWSQASSAVGGAVSAAPSCPLPPSFWDATLPHAASPTPPNATTKNEARFDRMHVPRGSTDTEGVLARQNFSSRAVARLRSTLRGAMRRLAHE